MQVFSKYKYNVKTCMYTISPSYKIINFKCKYIVLKATLCDFYPHLAVKRYMTIQ